MSGLVTLSTQVALAAEKYYKWFENKSTDRGKNGFFTWIRHSQYGQNQAEELTLEISKLTDNNQAITKINEFLCANERRYHRHSFSSFLLDELRKIPNSPWQSLTPNQDSNKYSEDEVKNSLKLSGP